MNWLYLVTDFESSASQDVHEPDPLVADHVRWSGDEQRPPILIAIFSFCQTFKQKKNANLTITKAWPVAATWVTARTSKAGRLCSSSVATHWA